FERLWPLEQLVAPFARKKTRQYRVIRLADQNQVIVLLLNDHWRCPHSQRATRRWGFFGCAAPTLQAPCLCVDSIMLRLLPGIQHGSSRSRARVRNKIDDIAWKEKLSF